MSEQRWDDETVEKAAKAFYAAYLEAIIPGAEPAEWRLMRPGYMIAMRAALDTLSE